MIVILPCSVNLKLVFWWYLKWLLLTLLMLLIVCNVLSIPLSMGVLSVRMGHG